MNAMEEKTFNIIQKQNVTKANNAEPPTQPDALNIKGNISFKVSYKLYRLQEIVLLF